MTTPVESKVERLRKQVERAIASQKSRKVVLPLLERLLAAAEHGSEASVYAHRQLAEHLVEHHPWRALLHIRQSLVQGERAAQGDDGLFALAGLAHALLGNYAAAAASYRRAVAVAPANPWYQHNLGHLLDVGLDQPAAARRHLEAAHRGAGPDDGEISASLAHCLARLGELDAALAHAEVAVTTSPTNAEHVRLRDWIRGGAVPGRSGSSGLSGPGGLSAGPSGRAASASETPPGPAASCDDAVTELLRAQTAGDPRLEERVLTLWADYVATKDAALLEATPAAVWAAMVDFACRDRSPSQTSPGEPLGLGRSRTTVSLAATARRYGVKTEALRTRWIALLEEWATAGGRWASLSREVDRRPAQKRAKD